MTIIPLRLSLWRRFVLLCFLSDSVGFGIIYFTAMHILSQWGRSKPTIVQTHPEWFLTIIPAFCFAIPLLLCFLLVLIKRSPPTIIFILCLLNALIWRLCFEISVRLYSFIPQPGMIAWWLVAMSFPLGTSLISTLVTKYIERYMLKWANQKI
jgi:tellurite resistance protein TehA-like permease